MPRLREVPKSEASAPIVARMYERLFGDRDPVAEPGTATGTPGDWWTVFALVPDMFEHAVRGFGLYRSPDRTLDPDAARARPDPGRVGAGQPVRVLAALQVVPHPRHVRGEDRRHPAWGVADCFTPVERAVLAYTDALVLDGGRVPTSSSTRCGAT